ncbi:SagB family peptide dehydrogenase [Paenibacillus sp. GP183]|uniref:SagB family peptide dehydrogenase n=1 Tax=Paenibacillus sp. GP183 TaxID=1882751 RepID=UPI00089C31B2|nr:SagB family peptide dehydrogenase [Paenibacillus sp. GP183]SEC06085.1 SagB-type dehydrogenase domain-containing protein [Paenibacillus sp. GP183]
MSLEAFLHDLHADTNASRPPDEVDWEDAPLKYKLYRGLPAFPLSPEVSLTLEGRELPSRIDLTCIGHFLWYVFGLTQLSHSYLASINLGQSAGPLQMYRRFVPSGGGLYPNEVYVYLKTKDIPAGVYHYDAAHHRLILLREGDFDSYLKLALGNRCDLSACFGTVFISSVFWKNFFKYNNFAYRLQGLDTGVLIGQLLEVAKRFGFASRVYFQFLDRAVNHLLGLSDKEENVYAVIPLSTEPVITRFAVDNDRTKKVLAAELCRDLPAVLHDRYEKSRKVKDFPMIIKMNEASMMDSSESFRQIGVAQKIHNNIQLAYMPHVERLSYDLASICRKRYSPETDFVLSRVTQPQLAALLQEALASFSYRNDLENPHEKSGSRVSVYACLYNVEDVPNGAYRYDSANHALSRILPGDHRLRLQQGMSLDNINLFQVPICLHVAGEKDFFKTALGYRGYRIQQMEAGMLVQRLLLAACATGMGGRPLLGFNASNSDEIYKMALQGETSLIQIPIGLYRHRPRLEAGLHS